jgi:hypothetical protein
MRILSLFAILGFLSISCSTTRIVKPLEAKEIAAGFDLGGPIIDFAGAKIPVPFSSISAAYGIDSMMTVWTGLHTTSMAFGNFQTDIGLLRDIIPAKGRRPGFSIAPVANVLFNFKAGDFRIYPEIDLNLHWQYSLKRKNFMYLGLSNWFDPWAKKAHNEPNKNFYALNIALGHTFVTNKMRYSLEFRWLAPHISNRNVVVGYNGIAGQGSTAFYFGLMRKF